MQKALIDTTTTYIYIFPNSFAGGLKGERGARGPMGPRVS